MIHIFTCTCSVCRVSRYTMYSCTYVVHTQLMEFLTTTLPVLHSISRCQSASSDSVQTFTINWSAKKVWWYIPLRVIQRKIPKRGQSVSLDLGGEGQERTFHDKNTSGATSFQGGHRPPSPTKSNLVSECDAHD